MPAAKKKLTVVEVEALPTDPLAAAIAVKAQTHAALVAKLEALQRARDGVTAAERHLEECRGAIAKAKETDIRAASTSLDKGDQPATPWHLSNAISSVERAETVLEVADAARTRKHEEVRIVEDDDAAAENDIRVCVMQKTLPEILRQLEELRQAQRRVAILRRSLAEYLDNDPRYAPRFHDDMRGFSATAAREAVFAGVKAEVDHLLCGPSMDDHEAGLAAAKLIKAALVALRTDPDVELPKV